MAKHIVVIPGDGIGKEITDAAVKVLQKIDSIYHIGLTFETKDAGGTAYDKFGMPLPEDTIAAAKQADAILFGAVGGDQCRTETASGTSCAGTSQSVGIVCQLASCQSTGSLGGIFAAQTGYRNGNGCPHRP